MTLERIEHKVFASEAPLDEMGQFGSALATTKFNTKDVTEIQALPAYTRGWGSAIISENNYPPMEEMNGVLNVMSYHTGYLYQEGIPVYSSTQTYSATSIVKSLDGKSIYRSLKGDNKGNPLEDGTSWELFDFSKGAFVKKTGDTMTGNLVFDFDDNLYRGINSTFKGYEIGVKPSEEQRGLRSICYDKNGEYVTAAQARCKADGWNGFNILARNWNFDNNAQTLANLIVQVHSAGDSGLWFNSKQMLYVEDFYVSGSSFYMIFNKIAGQRKRFCIQGGAYDNTAGGNSLKSVSYLKEFYSDGNCLWLTNVSTDSSQTASMRATSIYSKSATGFEIYRANNTPWIYWLAIGYLAEGQ